MIENFLTKPVRAAAILTNGYVAGTVIERARPFDYLQLLVDFTIGSLTSLDIIVEFSNDNGTTWFQQTATTYTGGVTTAVANNYAITATGKLALPPIQIMADQIRVSAHGTGTVTGSSAAISAVLFR